MDTHFLETLRTQIDTLDFEIIYLLHRRFEIAKQVGAFKIENNLEVLDENRFSDLLEKLKAEAKELCVNPELVEGIWKLIHEESINTQNKK